MFAVIKTGGKQYKVAAQDEIVVMMLPGEAGTAVTFDEVLSFSEAGTTEVGTPLVAGASVAAEIVAQKRGPKVIAFKKRRRKNSRRKRGHRQDLTLVRITEILTAGQTPSGGQRERAEAQVDVPAAHASESAPAEAAVA
jgi:large subunit ribosomal protein L21